MEQNTDDADVSVQMTEIRSQTAERGKGFRKAKSEVRDAPFRLL